MPTFTFARIGDVHFYFFLTFLLFTYLVLRAVYVPLVHDEAATFFHFINSGIIAPYKAIPDAANHLLNSYISRFFYLVFGNGEWVIRLANLCFFPVYALYTWLLGKQIKSPFLLWGFLLAMLGSHYLVEHFAYSRGYAMSLALLLAALYHLLQFIKNNKQRHLVAGLVAISLMVFANLSTMNTGLMLLFLLGVSVGLKKRNRLINFLFFVPVATFLAYLAKFSLWMGSIGSLYYGGDSFLTYTVQTLWPLWSGSSSLVGYILLMVLVLLGAVISMLALKKSNFHLVEILSKPKHIFLLLFTGNIAGVFLLYWLFDVNFPEDRVAMHFIPLLLGWLFFAANDTNKRILNYVLFGLSCLLPAQLVVNANTTHSTFWLYERIAPSHFQKLTGKTDEHGYPVTVSARLIKRLGWGYKIFSENLELNQVSYVDFPGIVEDYIMLHEWQKSSADLSGYRLVTTDPVNQLHLYERKHKLKRIPITEKLVTEKSDTNDEFIDFYKDTIPHLVGKSLLAGLDFEAQLNDAKTTNFRVVVAVEDNKGNTLKYVPFICDWHRQDWSKPQQFKLSLVVNEVPAHAYKLKCYMWNRDKVRFKKVKCSLGLFELSE